MQKQLPCIIKVEKIKEQTIDLFITVDWSCINWWSKWWHLRLSCLDNLCACLQFVLLYILLYFLLILLYIYLFLNVPEWLILSVISSTIQVSTHPISSVAIFCSCFNLKLKP